MQPVVLVVGVAGSGKSWVCRQLTDIYDYVPHDRCWEHPDAAPGPGLDVAWGPKGSRSTHLETLLKAARSGRRPVLTEAPFGERKLKEDLEAAGVEVRPVFVVEDARTVHKRFMAREGSPPSAGVMTRLAGMKARAVTWNAFWGTSAEVLVHLKAQARLPLMRRTS
jgi:hypothetical protein